jgi:RNA polymerase sigma-70 factor (ECF subfamily)
MTAPPIDDFDAFYTATSRSLISQLYALTGDWAEAADCMQEAYARAWQKWSTVAGLDSPAAWVRTVGFRVARSRWRRAQHALSLYRRTGLPDPVAAPSIDAVALATALRGLPETQRRALVLFHLADLSVAEVASEMGVPDGTVKSALSRGRAALAQTLRDDLEQSHV